MTRRRADIIGMRFGRLIAIKFVEIRPGHGAHWLCKCDCGGERIARVSDLNGGRVLSCGCWAREVTARIAVKGIAMGNRKILPPGVAPFRRVYGEYRKNADLRGLVFDLNELQFLSLVCSDCYYCGAPPSNKRKSRGGEVFICNGVDRIDSSRGYSMDNVRPCCSTCNYLKMAQTESEFYDMVRHVAMIAEHLGIK